MSNDTPLPVPEKELRFMEELTALSKKHQLTIGGCGCCGSPWLEDLSNQEGRYIYNDRNGKLEWNTST